MATKRSANEVFQDYFQAMMFSLPMTDARFLDDLYKHISIHKTFKSNLESLTVRKERTSYFLDHIMKPQISVGDNTSFVKLLTVMKTCDYDNVKDLAEEMEAKCTLDIKCAMAKTIGDNSQEPDKQLNITSHSSESFVLYSSEPLPYSIQVQEGPYSIQVQEDESSEEVSSLSISVPSTVGIQDSHEHCVTRLHGSQVVKCDLEKLFINQLSTNTRGLKEIIYNFFLENFDNSPSNVSLEKQTPYFIIEIMAQESENDLFHLLKSKTPYCDFFNFPDFVESITKKISNEEVKEIILRSKEALSCMKYNDILPYLDEEHGEKKDFSKVVLQMTENFKIFTYEGIHRHKKLTSILLKLQNLVCFVRFDEEKCTVTYLIPSLLIEGACSSAKEVADRFHLDDVLQITIGKERILNVQFHKIQRSIQSSMKIKVYICLKDAAKFLEIDVKLSNPIGAVKWIIYKILYIPPDMQVLRYNNKNLENDKTVGYYKIEVSGTIDLTPEVEKIYCDVIELLPSNCQSAVGEWDKEINVIFRALSKNHDDHVSLYMHLLPYVYEKCDYNVLQFIDILMKAIKDSNKRKNLHEFKLKIIQLEDKIIRNIDDEPKKSVQSTQSQMPVTKAYTQPHGTVTDLQTSYSDEHHTPDVSNQTEVKVKDVNSISEVPTSLLADSSFPEILVSNEGFIEIKKHYHDILHLMPDNYEQTLHKLQSVITGDETAEILEIVSPDIANKKILDCLIQKMENREHMLDFCEHLEKVIASQNLKTIVSEIKTGVQQGIQQEIQQDIQSLIPSTHPVTLSSTVFKHPALQVPDLPFNLVHRQEPLDAIITKLCNETINQNAQSKVIAVTGVGGFGKTTIVVTLCHDHRVQEKFTGRVLFIELGPQAPDPKVKLNEIYISMVGKTLENNSKVETEIQKIFKDNFHHFLVIIDDVWDAEDAKPIITAFSKCHILFTTRRSDIALKLTVAENIVRVGPMKLNEAVTLLSDGLLAFDKASTDDKELLKELAQDAHMWPVLLCLVRGQLNHNLKLNIHVNKAIENVQCKLRERGLTAFDKSDVESASKLLKCVGSYIESTLELLPEAVLNKFVTLILFTGIGGIFLKAALSNLWGISDQEAQDTVKILSDYGLVSFKDITASQYIKNQVVVHTHSVISQCMFDNIRSDQVATLSPFGLLRTERSVGDKLELLFRNSYLQQDLKLSQLIPREYLTYTMLKIEHVVIPFQLKRITSHILHDPHVILLMLQKIHNTIRKSVSHIQIITKFGEQLVALDSRCIKVLKDSQVLNRIINSKVQRFLFIRDYGKLEKTLEEHCMAFSNDTIAQDCIELINEIIPMCEISISESFDFVQQMLETMTPQYHFVTMEKLPIMKLYIGLHRDIVSSLNKGSSEFSKMCTFIKSGDFIKKLEAVSSNYSSKLKEIAPIVLSNLATFKM